jgi:hypothetical protein
MDRGSVNLNRLPRDLNGTNFRNVVVTVNKETLDEIALKKDYTRYVTPQSEGFQNRRIIGLLSGPSIAS